MKEPRLLRRVPDLSKRPAVKLETGLAAYEGATQLYVYYPPDGNTYVVPCGEAENAEPWGYKGFQRLDLVLAWYLRGQLE